MTRRGRFVGMALLAVLGFAGCSSDDSDDSDANGSEGGNGGQVTEIHVTVEGDDVTPNGKQIEVPANEPIQLHITADRPGELHVHTDAGIEIEFAAGETTEELTLDRPGVYEVELHDPEKIIMELEAS